MKYQDARAHRWGPRALLAGIVAVATFVAVGCEVEQKVVRLRPPPVQDRATLPDPPDLEPTAEVIRYPDGAYSVDGLLREADKLSGEEIRLKGFVREVNVCDVEQDATCTSPPHAYLVDDPNRPKRAMLVVGSLRSRLTQMKPGQGETLVGRMAQVSPDGRFVRARGMLVLPDLEAPPVPPAPPGGADAGASGAAAAGTTAP